MGANQRRHNNYNTTAPDRYSQIIDAVCERDRQYFEESPGRTVYRRPYVPGEFWPLAFPQDTYIKVTLIGPGLRARMPYSPSVGDFGGQRGYW